MKPLTSRQLGFVAALLALAADQGSKLALLYAAGFARMAPGDTIPVLPFFNLVMVWNPGISYGLFPASSRAGTAVLVMFSVGAVLGTTPCLIKPSALNTYKHTNISINPPENRNAYTHNIHTHHTPTHQQLAVGGDNGDVGVPGHI